MAALAAKVEPETSPTTINKLEKDEIVMSADWARRLAAALEVDPLELLAPLADLSNQESNLVQLFRGLSDADQQAVYHVVQAIKSPEREEGSR